MKNSNISFGEFCNSFPNSYKDNFSHEGKRALFDYLERLEEDIGEEMECDPIAFCCEYSEYENLEELQKNYPDIETMDDLQNNTAVIMVDDTSFIIQDF